MLIYHESPMFRAVIGTVCYHEKMLLTRYQYAPLHYRYKYYNICGINRLHLSRPADIRHFIFCEVDPHHPCIPPYLKYFIYLSTCKNGNSFNFHEYFDMAIHYKLRFNIFTTLCHYNARILVRFWVETLQYGARCTHMRKKYFERKNRIGWSEAGQLQMDQSQPCTVWSLVFAFSVLPACSWAPLYQQFT